MEKSTDLEGKIDGVMDSLDGIRRADPGPWFFGRMAGRLVAQPRSLWSAAGSFLSKPAVAVSGVMAVLLLNFVLLLNEQSEARTAAIPAPVATENEYITASNSSFEYENLVQP